MKVGGAAIVAGALALFAADAAAQARAIRPAGPARIGIRGYVAWSVTTLAAAETFRAVADTTSAPTFGAGAQVTGLWRGIFADVGVSQHGVDGERVFVHNGDVIELGIPMEVRMRPLDLAAGWRVAFGRFSPYAGAGATFLSYRETSRFADAGEDVNESGRGPLVLAGVDVRAWRWVHAGAEVRYRRVRGILGAGGVSAEFGESDAGGVSAGLRVSVVR